ncbi:transcriptional regulator, TetR family [Bosea sp. OK403]|uniref:TetR/AcrR family transcriptional regulator n=1 Tax=Bosea sp. OK403 TaxID=1855286 RepID=UPI0008F1FD44|nr:TetR/AcrR family transcriptional regulator [Bosea sp. OK403]SFJ59638.1 transcriptional regulator, TetR family [Bosea sp. OK403]
MDSQKSSAGASKTAKITKTPSRGRGVQRVSALLDAASAVFAETGYEAATTTEIARRAKASIGSLYQFFPTKEHLAAALHARHLESLAAVFDSLAAEAQGAANEQGAASDGIIDELFQRLLVYLEANPAFLVLGERRSLDPAVKKQARARLRGGIAGLLQTIEPPVPRERIAPLAALILHLIRMAAMLRADDDLTIRDPAVAELREMLRRHLAATQVKA